jgi:hypothetical protein
MTRALLPPQARQSIPAPSSFAGVELRRSVRPLRHLSMPRSSTAKA